MCARSRRRPSPLTCASPCALGGAGAQVRALRLAFGTLSDVVLEEVDGLREDDAAVRSQSAAHVRGLAVALKNLKTEVQLLRAQVESDRERTEPRVAQNEDGIASLGNAFHQVAQQVQRLQTQAGETSTALEMQRSEAEQATSDLTRQLADVRDAVAAAERQTTADAATLASDLATVAEEQGAFQGKYKRQVTVILEQIRSLGDELQRVTERIRTAGEASEHSIAVIGDRVTKHEASTDVLVRSTASKLAQRAMMDREATLETVDGVQDKVRRLAASVEDMNASFTNEVQTLHGQMRNMEALVRAGLVEQERESRRRYDAVADALHRIAEKLNIAAPSLP